MEIKTDHGNYGVTGIGQGTYNTVAGSLGLASFLGLGANGGLGSLFGGSSASAQADEISKLRMENAILNADNATDKKLVEVFNAINDKANANRDRIDAYSRELSDKITAEREARLIAEGKQEVINALLQTGEAVLDSQVKAMQATLASITTSVIPSSKICDTGCGCNN